MTDIYPVAVTGASGQFGRLAIDALLTEQGVPADQIIALTRRPESLSELADQGLQVRQVDFNDTASVNAAFNGVNRLLLISTDELAEPGKRLAQHKLAISGAEQAGLPTVLAKAFASFDSNTRQGGVAEVTNDFNQLTGREPMTLKDWLNQNRALFTTGS